MRDKNVFAWLARKAISRLANLTPNVIYYPRTWAAKINGTMFKIASRNGDAASVMTTAAVSMACAMHDHLPKKGDEAEIKLGGVSHGESEIGDFVVIVRRAA